MVDERAARRADFRNGPELLLADGQLWTLADRFPQGEDPEYDRTVRAVFQAQDEFERLLGEMAVCILLLSRNYSLEPEQLRRILSFPAGDPALIRQQQSLRAIIEDQARRHATEIDAGLGAELAASADWERPDPPIQPIQLRSLRSLFGGEP